jgi:hypothetical protein
MTNAPATPHRAPVTPHGASLPAPDDAPLADADTSLATDDAPLANADAPLAADDAAAQRVAACALGLAFAGRLDDACLAEILDMADGDLRLVARAHAAVTTLGVVDVTVADHARGLLLRAAADLPQHAALDPTGR